MKMGGTFKKVHATARSAPAFDPNVMTNQRQTLPSPVSFSTFVLMCSCFTIVWNLNALSLSVVSLLLNALI